MPAVLTVAGKAVTRGHVTLPRQGAWHADLWLDADTAPTGAVALSWGEGEATWQGTVARGGVAVEGGPAAVRVVGGGGGLGAQLPGASYRNASPRVILGQILGAAGERLSGTSPAGPLDAILARWSRSAGAAGAQVGRLAASLGLLWRVLPDGSIYVGAEPGGVLTLDKDSAVTARAPALGRTVLAPSAPWVLRPGQSFEGSEVREVVHRLSPSEIRSELWAA